MAIVRGYQVSWFTLNLGHTRLKRVVQPLSNAQVGVVTCLYRSQTQGWIATFEAIGISTEFLPSVLVARQLEGMTFALGATIVIRKAVLEAIGGFVAVADYLEDDFQLGYQPSQLGYQVMLSDYIVDHVMATESLSDLAHHQIRWTRGIRFARPWGYAWLIFTCGTVSSLILLLVMGGTTLGWMTLGMIGGMQLILAWVAGVYYFQDAIARKWLWLTPLRDLMSFAFWCYSFAGNTVEWRHWKMQLAKGGKLVMLSQTS